MTDPGFDILPVYYTDAINTDSWLMENPWINEINEENPYGYTIEINAATARAKGFASGDKVRLVTVDGVSVEGVLATSEGVHFECVAVIGGHWGSKSAYMPLRRTRAFPLCIWFPVRPLTAWIMCARRSTSAFASSLRRSHKGGVNHGLRNADRSEEMRGMPRMRRSVQGGAWNPSGITRSHVKREFEGEYPDATMHIVPMLCMHCENPPCVEACPTEGATYKREDGIVVMDKEKCIGCKSCIMACPYGARYYRENEDGYFGTELNEYEAVMYTAMPQGRR